MKIKIVCNCSNDYDILHEKYHELNTKFLDALLEIDKLKESNKELKKGLYLASDHANEAKRCLNDALDGISEYYHSEEPESDTLVGVNNDINTALMELDAIRNRTNQ